MYLKLRSSSPFFELMCSVRHTFSSRCSVNFSLFGLKITVGTLYFHVIFLGHFVLIMFIVCSKPDIINCVCDFFNQKQRRLCRRWYTNSESVISKNHHNNDYYFFSELIVFSWKTGERQRIERRYFWRWGWFICDSWHQLNWKCFPNNGKKFYLYVWFTNKKYLFFRKSATGKISHSKFILQIVCLI